MRKITIPKFLSHLPVDGRGYPIPFFVAMPGGKPDFRLLDERKQLTCIKHHLCSICGKQLFKSTYYFISGPYGVNNRIATDPPMHLECAEYSMETCPHLLLQKAERRDRDDLMVELEKNNPQHAANKQIPKPDKLYLVKARNYKVEIQTGNSAKMLRFTPTALWEYEYRDGILVKTGNVIVNKPNK